MEKRPNLILEEGVGLRIIKSRLFECSLCVYRYCTTAGDFSYALKKKYIYRNNNEDRL